MLALKTAGGGVLAFYALTAQLTLAPPPGQTFQVSIPGFYSTSQTLTSATVEYAEYAQQFAAYLPPDQASPQILADASGITGRGSMTGCFLPASNSRSSLGAGRASPGGD